MFDQVYKKRGGGNGGNNDSTFETNQKKTEIPDVSGALIMLDKSIRDAKSISVVEEKTVPYSPKGSCCFR